MSQRVSSVDLWVEEGTGAFNSWRERVTLTMRATGHLVVAVTREPIDDSGPRGRVYRSKPFKRYERLVGELQRAAENVERGEYRPAEVIRMLSRAIELDPQLAGKLLRIFAATLDDASGTSVDLLPD